MARHYITGEDLYSYVEASMPYDHRDFDLHAIVRELDETHPTLLGWHDEPADVAIEAVLAGVLPGEDISHDDLDAYWRVVQRHVRVSAS